VRRYLIGICDDEKGTCAEIEKSVYRFFESSEYDVDVEVWFSGEDCIKSLNEENNIDIIFLDIELPGANGVNIGKHIRDVLDNDKLQIVFISSKTGYALELFQIHPYDFLIKPVTYQVISAILEKLLNLDENDRKTLRYRHGRTEGRIPLGKIMYLESHNKHINVQLVDGSVVEYTGKLSEEKEKLPAQFITVAKSFIVNMKFISSFCSSSLIMQNGIKINITAPHRDEFRLSIAQYFEGGV